MTFNLHKLHDVRVYAALVSLLLSAWSIYTDDVINNDGILYVRVAELITHGEWNAAVSLYKWPFYSALIALTGVISGLALEPAAHVLNALLVVLAVVSFITLVQMLGGDRKTLTAAAAVVLLYPGLNEFRSYVIRDFGYVAFYLLALVFYFKTLNTTDWRLHAAWFTAAVIASLFRIEGFALVLAMLILARAQHWERRLLIAKASAVVAAALAVMFLVFLWWIVGPMGGFGDVVASIEKIWQPSAERTAVLREVILPKWSADHAPMILFAGGVTILSVEVISRLTVVNALLAGHAWYRRLLFPLNGAKRLWIGLVTANLVILAAIVAGVFFLTGRFPVAFSLTVMLAVPFSLRVLYEEWRAIPPAPISRNWKFPAIAILLLLTGLSGVTEFTDKGYLKEGALWIKTHSAPGARLFTNDSIVMHYSGRGVYEDVQIRGPERTERLIQSGEWQAYDYLALNLKRGERDRTAHWRGAFGREPVKVFANDRGNQLLIFAPKAAVP
jgi:hypothetical protein